MAKDSKVPRNLICDKGLLSIPNPSFRILQLRNCYQFLMGPSRDGRTSLSQWGSMRELGLNAPRDDCV